MRTSVQTTERIEALRALVDRPDSPDLTPGEAKALRCRLLESTGEGENAAASRRSAPQAASSTDLCDGQQHGTRTLACRNCAA
jgi:hypothetical protein